MESFFLHFFISIRNLQRNRFTNKIDEPMTTFPLPVWLDSLDKFFFIPLRNKLYVNKVKNKWFCEQLFLVSRSLAFEWWGSTLSRRNISVVHLKCACTTMFHMHSGDWNRGHRGTQINTVFDSTNFSTVYNHLSCFTHVYGARIAFITRNEMSSL